MNTTKDLVQQQNVLDIIETYQYEDGALLPILHEIQELLGFIPEQSLPVIARALNLSRAEVYGVVTYYHYFRLTPPAPHVVQICRAEACQARGANQLIEHAQQHLGCQFHEMSHDGNISLEPIYCLGQCAVGPTVLVDDSQLYAHVNNAAFDALITHLSQAKGDGQ